jgi:hypothetical protein
MALFQKFRKKILLVFVGSGFLDYICPKKRKKKLNKRLLIFGEITDFRRTALIFYFGRLATKK